MLTMAHRHNLKTTVQYAVQVGHTAPEVPATPSRAQLRAVARAFHEYLFGSLGFILAATEEQPHLSADLCHHLYHLHWPAQSWSSKDICRALALALILRAYAESPNSYHAPTHTPAAREASASFTELCKLIALRRRSTTPWRDQTPLLRALYRVACHLARTTWASPYPLQRVDALDDTTSVRDEAGLALCRYHSTLRAIAHRDPSPTTVPQSRPARYTCAWLNGTAAVVGCAVVPVQRDCVHGARAPIDDQSGAGGLPA